MERSDTAIMANNLSYVCYRLELSMERIAGMAHLTIDELNKILAPPAFPERNEDFQRILNALCTYLMTSVDIFTQKDMKKDNMWPQETIDYLRNQRF
jgi:hypothetical protein